MKNNNEYILTCEGKTTTHPTLETAEVALEGSCVSLESIAEATITTPTGEVLTGDDLGFVILKK